MTGPTERALALLSALSGGRAWTGAELAARLSTSPRTLRRDVDRLRSLGYPVRASSGVNGSYRLDAGVALPPLVLSDEEAVAVAVGLRLAALVQVEGLAADAAAALAKLTEVLPSRLRPRMRALATVTEAAERPVSPVSAAALEQIASAAHQHLHLHFGYGTARRVEPYRQALVAGRWYLQAWDLDRADWRTFRVDKIRDLVTPGSTFVPREPPESGPLSLVRRGQGRQYDQLGVVSFAAPLSEVAPRLVAQAGALEAVDEQSCRYVTGADSWPWLAAVLAQVGVPYRVEGPAELITATREQAARMTAAAAGGGLNPGVGRGSASTAAG